MKTNKKTKPKQYDKFLGMPAPMWAFLCLAIFTFACISELNLRNETKRKIDFIEKSYDSLEKIKNNIIDRYEDMTEISLKIIDSQRKKMEDQRWKIKELQERGDFYCDAYQSCMIAFEKYVGEKGVRTLPDNKEKK